MPEVVILILSLWLTCRRLRTVLFCPYVLIRSDAAAAKCLHAVRSQLKELEAQQSIVAAEVAAEREAADHINDLRNTVLRLKFEIDYASRKDGMPDAPGDGEREHLDEIQQQFAEAQAALEVG